MTRSAIKVVVCPGGARIERPGARYAIHREGEAHAGAWLPEGDPLPKGRADIFPEAEARAMLPLLRAQARGGRPPADPTTPDGLLIARACEALGLSDAALAQRVGAHEGTLSKARNGRRDLPMVHRKSIRALLRATTKPRTTR